MPRKAKRTPRYEGRPDLQQPMRTPTGLPYGENIALQESQRAAPLHQQPTVQDIIGRAKEAAAAMPFPGDDSRLNAPTRRPLEPLTAGLAVGAGPGPEVLGPPPGAPTASRIFSALAAATGDSEMLALAQLAEAQGA